MTIDAPISFLDVEEGKKPNPAFATVMSPFPLRSLSVYNRLLIAPVDSICVHITEVKALMSISRVERSVSNGLQQYGPKL